MAERRADPPISGPELAGIFTALATADGADPARVLELLTERIVAQSLAAACTAHLVDDADELQVLTTCPDQGLIEQLGDLQRTDGPSVEALRTGVVHRAEDLEHFRTRWPSFAPEAHRAGYRAAEATPLLASNGVVGVVTTLHVEPLTPDDAGRGQIVRDLAIVAATRLTDQQALSDARTEAQRLTQALHSRVIIEQAKGMLAATQGGSPEESFELLRRYARHHNRVLSEVAEAIVTRVLDLTDLALPG